MRWNARGLFVLLMALCAFAACSQSQTGPNAGGTPTPSNFPTDPYQSTSNAEPQNCVRKTEDFRYYDNVSGTPMPWLQNYTPYPGYPVNPNIQYYMALPTGQPSGATPIAIELTPGAKPPQGAGGKTNAAPYVPIIAWSMLFGVNDLGDVVLIPSGQLANDYEKDLAYHAQQQNFAQQMAAATIAGQHPTPIPTNSALAAFDAEFQAYGTPAVSALSRGVGADDRYFKGMTYFGQQIVNMNPHPRIAACDWLQNVPYDLILTVLRKRPLSPSAYATLAASLTAQNAPSSMLSSQSWVAYEKDTYVTKNVQPQLWLPPNAQAFPDNLVFLAARAYPTGTPLATVQLPTQDQTSPP
jgi:hypothetical protein